jgi:hypothetical protein
MMLCHSCIRGQKYGGIEEARELVRRARARSGLTEDEALALANREVQAHRKGA